ncbi:hypothetical protein Htur_0788 [Haloterrigena turkmenica DSM 5511]|uniref:DUF8173 domain-containing protein n=1 Tax=Haloterrigena turkmenica (strain ATCC 51198 / DSM 5511 / JCM 9101 / NCIMB 13204 / VKM B-1734 / 4k) TaxID=543526 RepID=D2RX72_HALTV|nr:US12 family protein [Haloterrigena turkmenica]ADB59684.1 hypothetical protein Htur_0788 [Haloterrigena turkmenica DSM 5511]
MSPLAVAPEIAFAPFALASADSDPTASLAASSVGAVVPRPFWLPLGTTLVAFLVGVVLLAAASTFTRTVSDDIAERPDRSFAVGFLGLFGLLVAVTLPLVLSTAVEHPVVSALTAVVAAPGLFVWGLAVVVGSCLGAVAMGDRVVRRRSDSASLVPATVVGAVVLGASQLVPVFGALVAMGLATVAVGAVARRRFDVDERLFDGDAASESAGRSEIGRSSAGWETEPDRTPSAVTWNSGDESAGQPADREDRSWPDGTEAVLERDDDDDSGRDEIDIVGDDENWTVGGWRWDADPDDDRGSDAEPSREEPADEQ